MSIVLVTGATDGIGLETAQQLARLGHELVLHGRSAEKAQHACAEVRQAVPGAVLHAAHADLGDLDEVARMAADINRQFPHLDVLINNAGVYLAVRKLSRQGYEMTLAVNHLAHFLLTLLLLPLLQKSPEPRVVTVSSVAHQSGRIPFDDMNGEHHYDGYHAYANSKLANALFATELAQCKPWLCSNSLHPGVIDTKLLHAGFDMTGAPVAEGARTSVFLASADEMQGISGKYFERRTAVAPSPLVADAQLAQRLWNWTLDAVQPQLSSGTPGPTLDRRPASGL